MITVNDEQPQIPHIPHWPFCDSSLLLSYLSFVPFFLHLVAAIPVARKHDFFYTLCRNFDIQNARENKRQTQKKKRNGFNKVASKTKAETRG